MSQTIKVVQMADTKFVLSKKTPKGNDIISSTELDEWSTTFRCSCSKDISKREFCEHIFAMRNLASRVLPKKRRRKTCHGRKESRGVGYKLQKARKTNHKLLIACQKPKRKSVTYRRESNFKIFINHFHNCCSSFDGNSIFLLISHQRNC